jgi:hypothetical protein
MYSLRNTHNILVRNPERKKYRRKSVVCKKSELKWILNKWDSEFDWICKVYGKFGFGVL